MLSRQIRISRRQCQCEKGRKVPPKLCFARDGSWTVRRRIRRPAATLLPFSTKIAPIRNSRWQKPGMFFSAQIIGLKCSQFQTRLLLAKAHFSSTWLDALSINANDARPLIGAQWDGFCIKPKTETVQRKR